MLAVAMVVVVVLQISAHLGNDQSHTITASSNLCPIFIYPKSKHQNLPVTFDMKFILLQAKLYIVFMASVLSVGLYS